MTAPKGLILVGGLGTQLRPLTLTKPKALIDFGNKPLLLHFIEALVRAGVTEIVLAISYRPEVLEECVQKCQLEHNIKITCSQEHEPLGTAGPIALARSSGLLDDQQPIFVMNCDTACDFNLRALYDFHVAHGKMGTIMVTRVDEPAKYGKSVVVAHQTGLVERFVEHGRTFAGNLINAGVYIFSPAIFERIRPGHASMEREVLPQLAAEDQLYSMGLEGYWMNVKKPRDFLQGHSLYLSYLAKQRRSELAEEAPAQPGPPRRNRSIDRLADCEKTPSFIEPVICDPSAKVGEGCHIGPEVTIGPGCVIEDGVRLSRCILLEGVRVCAHSTVQNSILGWKSSVGKWTRVEGVCVLGLDVHVGDELFVNGALILPHKSIDTSVAEPQIIM